MIKDAFILDLNLLNEQNLSYHEFILLIKIKYNQSIQGLEGFLKELENKLFIKITDSEIILREKGNLILELITLENYNLKDSKKIKKSSRLINNELSSFIKEYRNLWKGLKPGSMGNEEACKEKMFRWMKENPEKTKEDIMRAARIYINSVSDYNYLQQADYFIYKKEGPYENSRLSNFIDEEETPAEGWTSQIR